MSVERTTAREDRSYFDESQASSSPPPREEEIPEDSEDLFEDDPENSGGLRNMEQNGSTPNSDWTDADRLAALDEVSENSDEEAPETPVSRFTAYLQGHGQKEITEEKVIEAMKKAGLREEDLGSLTLPSSTPGMNKKVFDFLKSINPQFARIVSEHANNPFVDEVRTGLSQTLEALSAETVVSLQNLDKVIEDAVDLPFPSSSETDRQMGNSGTDTYAKECLKALNEASQSGNANNAYFSWQSDGLNWDRGNFGNAWRRGLGALYGALGKDKTLFKAVLKKNVPEVALRAIHSGFKPGGHHNSLPGDLLSTPEIIAILEEIFQTPPAR